MRLNNFRALILATLIGVTAVLIASQIDVRHSKQNLDTTLSAAEPAVSLALTNISTVTFDQVDFSITRIDQRDYVTIVSITAENNSNEDVQIEVFGLTSYALDAAGNSYQSDGTNLMDDNYSQERVFDALPGIPLQFRMAFKMSDGLTRMNLIVDTSIKKSASPSRRSRLQFSSIAIPYP